MCTLTLSSVKDALVVQGLIPTISTLGREVAPNIGAKQPYEICLLQSSQTPGFNRVGVTDFPAFPAVE